MSPISLTLVLFVNTTVCICRRRYRTVNRDRIYIDRTVVFAGLGERFDSRMSAEGISPRGRASSAFVEDAIIFVVTIVPLAYFFGGPPLLLATLAHLVSVPCAGVAHSSKLGRAQTFFLSLASVTTTLVDIFVAAYCACRVVPTNLCCVALSSIGVSCLDDLADAPLALFLLPVSVFNALTGISRVVIVWLDATPRARSGVSFAFVVCVKAAHVALLWSHPRDVVVAHLLRLVVAYAGISAIVASIDWNDASSDALAGCFFLDQIVLALQVHETLAGRTSSHAPLGLAVASLVVTSGLAILTDEKRYDAWSAVYAVAFTAFHATILTAWWSELDAPRGAIATAYLASPLARTYALRADGFAIVAAIACFFFAVDTTVAVVVGIVSMTSGRFLGVSPFEKTWVGWGLLGSTVVSAVVSFVVFIENIRNIRNAKAHAKTVVTSLSTYRGVDAAYTPDESEKFVSDIKNRVDGRIITDIVEYARQMPTIGERARLLNQVFTGDSDAAWDAITSAIYTEETLGEMDMTRTTYESAMRRVDRGDKTAPLRMPMKIADAERFAVNNPIMFERKWTFATSRHSYGKASVAKKIEALWNIVDWQFCDDENDNT